MKISNKIVAASVALIIIASAEQSNSTPIEFNFSSFVGGGGGTTIPGTVIGQPLNITIFADNSNPSTLGQAWDTADYLSASVNIGDGAFTMDLDGSLTGFNANTDASGNVTSIFLNDFLGNTTTLGQEDETTGVIVNGAPNIVFAGLNIGRADAEDLTTPNNWTVSGFQNLLLDFSPRDVSSLSTVIKDSISGAIGIDFEQEVVFSPTADTLFSPDDRQFITNKVQEIFTAADANVIVSDNASDFENQNFSTIYVGGDVEDYKSENIIRQIALSDTVIGHADPLFSGDAFVFEKTIAQVVAAEAEKRGSNFSQINGAFRDLTASTIAHESGHLFGIQHSLKNRIMVPTFRAIGTSESGGFTYPDRFNEREKNCLKKFVNGEDNECPIQLVQFTDSVSISFQNFLIETAIEQFFDAVIGSASFGGATPSLNPHLTQLGDVSPDDLQEIIIPASFDEEFFFAAKSEKNGLYDIFSFQGEGAQLVLEEMFISDLRFGGAETDEGVFNLAMIQENGEIENIGTVQFSTTVISPVPEPAMVVLFGISLVGLGYARWRRRAA